MLRAFRICFFIDSDYGVETFAETVILREKPGESSYALNSRAWDKAVKQARADGGTNSGRSLASYEWQNVTEIDSFEFPHAYALKLRADAKKLRAEIDSRFAALRAKEQGLAP